MAYLAPTPAGLKARYPAFGSVADPTVQIWLDEAAAECANWPEDYRARAQMAYAAHRMIETGAVTATISAGVTSFKSGTFSATVSESVANRTGYDATIYGREFIELRRRFFSVPLLAGYICV